MQKITPVKSLLLIWRIYLAIFCVIPASLSAYFFPNGGIVRDIITITWLVLFVAMFFILLPYAYAKMYYRYDKQSIIAQYGMIYHREKTLMLSGVKFISLTSSPFERIFSLYSLKFVATGSTLTVKGLRRAQADELIKFMGENYE